MPSEDWEYDSPRPMAEYESDPHWFRIRQILSCTRISARVLTRPTPLEGTSSRSAPWDDHGVGWGTPGVHGGPKMFPLNPTTAQQPCDAIPWGKDQCASKPTTATMCRV